MRSSYCTRKRQSPAFSNGTRNQPSQRLTVVPFRRSWPDPRQSIVLIELVRQTTSQFQLFV